MMVKNTLPLVSIIIPCYNSVDFISECIDSVLDQNYQNLEIIVVDDGSTDGTLEVISRYERIRVISQSNSGACVARNRGLKLSKGKYVKFLDSDDFLEPGVIKAQVELSEKLDENAIVYGNYNIVRGDRKSCQDTFIGMADQTAILMIADILISTPLHRKWMLELVDGFDERLKNGQEWNLHIRLSSEGVRFIHHRGSVFNYRIHKSVHRISNRKVKEKERIFYDLEKLKMTIDKLGKRTSGDIHAAVSLRYWWAARKLYRLGDKKQYKKVARQAKATSTKYQYYWPFYYKVTYNIFGFSLTELIFNTILFFRKRKFM